MERRGAFVGLLWVESWRGEPIDGVRIFFGKKERGLLNLKKKEPERESFPAVEDSLPGKKESYLERRA